MAKAKLKQQIDRTSAKRSGPRKKSLPPTSKTELIGKNLGRALEQFQSEPDEKKAHERWKKIEASVFGAQFED